MNKKIKAIEDIERASQAFFGAGCFWGVEEYFRKIEGVLRTEVGYTGGHLESPSYEDVCSGETGHAEVLRLWYDPEVISYETLLKSFWSIHDPTTLNRQGPDVGTQYRSVIFYTDEKQQESAKKALAQLSESGHFESEIVTEIAPATTFYPAEEYHQQYIKKRNGTARCKLS